MNEDPSDGGRSEDYEALIASAIRLIEQRELAAARRELRRAIATEVARPEAFNLLGALEDLRGRRVAAQRFYRAALALDPAYAPATENLTASTGPREFWRTPRLSRAEPSPPGGAR